MTSTLKLKTATDASKHKAQELHLRVRMTSKTAADRPKNKAQKEHLASLMKELDHLMALDRILEARKIVDVILDQYSGMLSDSQHQDLQEIVKQSDHVSAILRELMSDDGWTLSRKKHGVTVHYRHEPPSPIHAVKTRTVFENVAPIDFVHLCATFIETDLMPLWFPGNILRSVDVLASPTNYHQILHMKMSLGRFSPIAPRDTVLDGRGYHLSDRNAVMVFSKSITSSDVCEVPPPQKPYVRMDNRLASVIQLLPNQKMVFCQIHHNDLKIKCMPAWLLNFLSEGTVPFDMVVNLKKAMASFEGSEWAHRVKVKRSLYQDIEERLEEELANMEAAATEENAEIEWEMEVLEEEEEEEESVSWGPRIEIAGLLAVVVAGLCVGLDWVVLLSIASVFVISTRVFRKCRTAHVPSETKAEQISQPPLPASSAPKEEATLASADTAATSTASLNKKTKRGRGKLARRLSKAVTAPMGMVRKRKQRRAEAKSKLS